MKELYNKNYYTLHLITKEREDYENLEADEFAARFLMPKALLFSLNYYYIASAAEYLMVSQTAL